MSGLMAAKKKATAKKSGPKAKTASKAKSSSKAKSTSRAKAPAKKRGAGSRRELIDTGTDKRFVRRGAKGQFKESDDVGRSLAADRRRKAKTKAKRGQGDKGDR